jgi:predicted ATP-grasp superfamily ATP-dependent carboligase
VSARKAGGEAAAIDTSVPILALRRNGDPLLHTDLAIARTAGRLGIRVYGVFTSRWDPTRLSRYRTGHIRLDRHAGDDEWLAALAAFSERLGPAVLVPIDDTSAVFVGDHADALRQGFLFPEMSRSVYRRLSSKREMHGLCETFGIPVPRSSFPADLEQLRELARDQEYPMVLKQSDGWLPSFDPAAPSVLIARNESQLLDGYRRMEAPDQPNVIFQEYIPGGSDTIWIFNGYFNRDSRCLAGFTGRKLRQRGPHTGPATLGECVSNEIVADATRRLAREMGYQGIIDIGYRFDHRDGAYKLLDVNPRLGSSFRIFVGDDGLDAVRALYLDLTGQAVPPSSATDGRKWANEPYDLVAAAQLAREGSLRGGEWLRSFRGVRETAWFAGDDPLPFLGMAAHTASQGISKTIRSR